MLGPYPDMMYRYSDVRMLHVLQCMYRGPPACTIVLVRLTLGQ